MIKKHVHKWENTFLKATLDLSIDFLTSPKKISLCSFADAIFCVTWFKALAETDFATNKSLYSWITT